MAQLTDHMRALIQPHLADIEPYDPAFTLTRINLSANENTYPMPPEAAAAVQEALARVPLNRYPDPMSNELRDELAAWHGVARENICVGNGGDDLLYNFMLAFGGPGRALLNVPPAFSEYEFFAGINHARVQNVWRDPETFALDVDNAVIAATTCNFAILTSPNNPTGDLLDLASIERICNACPGPVMVDEAYGEFAPEGTSALALLDRCPNLIVLHTLSKAFGAAGIRCGYIIAAPEIIDVFAAVRQIYSVNVLTQAAALALVRQRSAYHRVVEQVIAERKRFYRALEELGPYGVTVWQSAANFLLVRMPEASTIRARLRDEYGILVRDFSSSQGLEGCLRITIGTPEEMDEVLVALTELLQDVEEVADDNL